MASILSFSGRSFLSVLLLMLGLLFNALPSSASADAVIKTSIISGDGYTPGSTLKVRVAVDVNTLGLPPLGAALRVNFNANTLTFTGVNGGLLGLATASSVQGSGAASYVNVSTVTNLLNTNQTPILFDVNFTVKASPTLPHSIILDDNSSIANNLIQTVLGAELAHSFNNIATINLGAPTPTPSPATTSTPTDSPSPSPSPTSSPMPSATPSPAAGTATISTSLLTGDGFTPGSSVTVRVAVTQNNSLLPPLAAALRVRFNANAVSFNGISDGLLGTAIAGPVQGSGANSYVDVATLTDLLNTLQTPTLFDLNFTVVGSPSTPHSILVQDDPNSLINLLGTPLGVQINHTFDNTATINLGPGSTPTITPTSTPPGGTAVIKTMLTSGDGYTPGSNFTVRVYVDTNSSLIPPLAVALRLGFNANSATFNGVSDGLLGLATASSVQNSGASAYVDVSTIGNPLNATLTPVLFDAHFTVKASPTIPYNIIASDNPAALIHLAGVGLLGVEINHVFDNGLTLGIGSGATPTPSPTVTSVPTATPNGATTTASPTPSASPTVSPTVAGGTTVIRTIITSGNGYTPGSQLVIRAYVSQNTGILPPIAANLRVSFNGDTLQLTGVSDGLLGTATASAVQGSGPSSYVNVSTAGNPLNSTLTPVLFDLTFTVKNPPTLPHSVTTADNPESLFNLVTVGLGLLSHTFDNQATINIGAGLTPSPSPTITPIGATPTSTPSPTVAGGTVVIKTSILSGDGFTPGSNLVIRVAVTQNTTFLPPIATNLRVTFNSDSLNYASVAAGDLGVATAGSVQGSGANAFINVATAGNALNTELQPLLFDVTFTVKASPILPHTIFTGDNDESAFNLVTLGLSLISHTFDNQATVSIGTGGITPTPTAAATATPTTAPSATATTAPTATATTPTATTAPTTTATTVPTATATIAPSVTATIAPTATATVAPSATATVAPTGSATATASATATPTVSPSPTPNVTPTPITYDFEGDQENWTYFSPQPFSAPGHNYNGARLETMTTDNTNNFGYWESPVFTIAVPNVTPGPGRIYQANFTVSSNVALDQAPLVRVRVSTEDFQHSDAVSITSFGQGTLSPTAEGRTYSILFNEQLATDRFRLDFDVLNFSTIEASSIAMLALESASLQVVALDDASFGTPSTVQVFNFSNNSNGFTARNAQPTIAAPAQMTVTPTGLLTRGMAPGPTNPNNVIFGFWGLESNIPIVAGKLYRINAIVSTDATVATREENPTFRLRMNDSSLMYSRILNIESTGDFSIQPLAGGARLYSAWFIPEPEIVGQDFILSFDYLFVDNTGADSTIGVTIQSMEIQTYDLP